MSISPVSDLVLDVVQAADPTRVLEAQEKLKVNKAQTEAVQLASAGKGFEASVVGMKDARTMKVANETPHVSKTEQTYRNFEAMVLQNFMQSIMPKDAEDVYGNGTTGEYWKDMMAEQIAKQISANGGIGIADNLLKAKDLAAAPSAADDLKTIASANPLTLGNASADRLIHENQLKVLDGILPGDHAANTQ